MKKSLKIVSFILLIIFVLLFGVLAYFLAVTKNVHLDEEKLKSGTSYPKILYSNGNEILNCDKFSYVTLDNIPTHVKNAVIAIEDKRFYSHNGVDARSILRALKTNLFSKSVKQGASTITQQLVKNTYLSGEKTINRKLKEIKLAYLLEQKLTKDEILEKYLNTVYFGENSYGIYSASKRFFNKEPKDLSIGEGATLIACLKAPSYYSPYKNLEKSTERKNVILNEMKKQGYISSNEYNKYKNQDICLNFKTNYDKNDCLYKEVLDEITNSTLFETPYGLSTYKIQTEIDEKLCIALEKLCDYDLDIDCSILVTENKSASVVGYYSTVGSLKRIPASTVKPFLIYAPAIEEDLICPATKILDEKTSFEGYSPSNYNNKYYGYVSVKDALKKSLNVPSIKVYNLLGGEKVKYYSNKMGIKYVNDDMSVALGNLTGGITLKELTDAYSVFLNDGNFIKSRYASAVKNKDGDIVYKKTVNKVKVYSNSTAYLINDILKDCAQNGTASKLSTLPFSVCAKTGTNGNEKGNLDAYCVAYTPNYTVSVWLGNADGSYFSDKISGGNYPTAIAKDVLTYLYPSGSADFFTKPDSVKEVEIDKTAYEKDYTIFQNTGDAKNGIKFFFKSNYQVKTQENKKVIPFIKDCKITCKNRDISFSVETDDNVYFLIFDEDGRTLFNSQKSGDFVFKATFDGEYVFFIQPYIIEQGGKFTFGEKIKLPSVLVEGKKEILDTEWWND